MQSHAMRLAHIQRGVACGYGPDAVTLLATPLYSNTTLVSFFPTLGLGGQVHLMAGGSMLKTTLAHRQRIRATHIMLVPVQYQRIMAVAVVRQSFFDRFRPSSAPVRRSAPTQSRRAGALARLIEFPRHD